MTGGRLQRSWPGWPPPNCAVAPGIETPDPLVLDEPTDGFSKEQLSRVGELLRDLDCEQVVLVSHERELESCADQVFEVVKDGTVSRIEAR